MFKLCQKGLLKGGSHGICLMPSVRRGGKAHFINQVLSLNDVLKRCTPSCRSGALENIFSCVYSTAQSRRRGGYKS